MLSDKRVSTAFALICIVLAAVSNGCAGPTGVQKESAPKVDSPPLTIGTSQPPGRYQLVTGSSNTAGPFLIDTSTGCVWHMVQNEKTKRPTFIEADVENLHWGWGSGAQQILAAQIDSLNYPEEQKRTVKQNLQKTECGQFNVTLSSESPRRSEQVPEAQPKGSEK